MEHAAMLTGRIAVVAGASRGCGRGIALALGEAGATVYVTGRTVRGGPTPVDNAPGTIEDTADEVTRRGGLGIPVCVDHTDSAQVASLFARVRAAHGRLDVLANAVWGGNERYVDPLWEKPFWEQPPTIWQEFVDAGGYAFWLGAHGAASVMKEHGTGLIVAITEPVIEGAFDDQHPALAESFGQIGHHTLNRLVQALAPEARGAGIAIVGLMPGFMKTERVERHLTSLGDEARTKFRYDLAETPEYAGRAVVALAADPSALEKAGTLFHVADLAEEYGFTDTDGKRVANFYRAVGVLP